MPARGHREDVGQRFAAFVSVDDETGCWRWTGGRDPDGYAIFWHEGTSVRAHRWAYRRWNDAVPDNLQLDHLCRQRDCVYPWHLEPVTNRENQMRGDTVTSANAIKTSCINGHPFDADNTYYHTRPRGGRVCRICLRAAVRRHDRRKRAQRGA